MSDQLLAIDQGTHSTRALVFDAHGRLLASARQAIGLQRRSRTEVEQSAGEILQSIHTVVAGVLQQPAVRPDRIACAGLATQRSSVLAWTRDSGDVLSPVLSWQDRRAADRLAALQGQAGLVHATTGLFLSPHYGASKLHWLLQHNTAVADANQAGNLTMGPLAAWLIRQLVAGEMAEVDHANASRTLLWRLDTRDWDPGLLAQFGIPAAVLPACRPIRHDYGNMAPAGIPLTAANGDQTAALYAHGKTRPDTLYINIGTGAFVLLPTGSDAPRPARLLTGISDSEDSHASHYTEGTVNSAAAAVKWAAERLGIADARRVLPAWLDQVTSPTLFINTLGGLGSPWWQDGPAPHFLDADAPREAAMVAVIESIVFLLQVNIEALRAVNPALQDIHISGGLSNLDGLCQRLADLSGLSIVRAPETEASARGIAWLAAGGPDDWEEAGEGTGFAPQDNHALSARYRQFVDILMSL